MLRRAALASVVSLGGACGFSSGVPSDASVDAAVADTSDAPIDVATLGPWSAPIAIDELNTATYGEDDPSLTDDLLEIYFCTGRPGVGTQGGEDIWMAKRAAPDQPWGAPAPVGELNTGFSDSTAEVSGDGLAIYLSSNRAGNSMDIYIATRASRVDPWGTPMRIGEVSEPSVNDWQPSVTRDQLRMFMCGDRTVSTDEDLYVATRTRPTELWNTPVRMNELSFPGVSDCDAMAPSPDVIYFITTMAGDTNIYAATRVGTGLYDTPVVQAPLSTTEREADPWVSANQRVIFFSSTRGAGGDDDLYFSTR